MAKPNFKLISGHRPPHRVAGLCAATLLTSAIFTGANAASSEAAVGPHPSTTHQPIKIAVVLKSLSNAFIQTVKAGAEAQAKAQGTPITVLAAPGVNSDTQQATELSDLGEQNFACYVVEPVDGTNLIQPMVSIAKKHVPIVNVDSPVDPAAAKAAGITIATYAGTNNTEAGKIAGKSIDRLLPQGGQVAIIGGPVGDVTSIGRISGFKSALRANVTLVQTEYANWDRPTALTDATDVLEAHPDLKGFFVADDDEALGVVRAVANAHMTGKVVVQSIDGIKQGLESIASHGLTATVSQYPYVIGREGVQACKAAVLGKTLPNNVATPIALITTSNVKRAIKDFPKPMTGYKDPYTKLLAGK